MAACHGRGSSTTVVKYFAVLSFFRVKDVCDECFLGSIFCFCLFAFLSVCLFVRVFACLRVSECLCVGVSLSFSMCLFVHSASMQRCSCQ